MWGFFALNILFQPSFLFSQIMRLEIEEISALRSFVFLWCGSGEGLDLGRMVTEFLFMITVHLVL